LTQKTQPTGERHLTIVGFCCRATPPTLLFITDFWGKLDLAIRPPIDGITSIPHIPVKTRIQPILWSRHQPMTHRIEMAVIHRLAKIPLIPNLMRPKPARPNRLLTLPQPRRRALSFIRRRAPTAEVTFEQSPAFRKISSPLRQLVGWALLRFLDDKDRVLAMSTLLSHQPGHRSKIWDHRLSPLTNATPILFILALPHPPTKLDFTHVLHPEISRTNEHQATESHKFPSLPAIDHQPGGHRLQKQ
jgi:hypothetical protein